jgi:hypothetical protein
MGIYMSRGGEERGWKGGDWRGGERGGEGEGDGQQSISTMMTNLSTPHHILCPPFLLIDQV